MKIRNIAIVAVVIICYCLSLATVALWHTHTNPVNSNIEITSAKPHGPSGSGHSPICLVCLKINSTLPWNDRQAIFNFSPHQNSLPHFETTEKLLSTEFQTPSDRAPPLHTVA